MRRVGATLFMVVILLASILMLGHFCVLIPRTPSNEARRVIAEIAAGAIGSRRIDSIQATLVGAHWFDAAVIPGIAGSIVGILSRIVSRIGWRSRLIAASLAALVLLMFHGLTDLAAWVGALMLIATVLGGSDAGRHLRQQVASDPR